MSGANGNTPAPSVSPRSNVLIPYYAALALAVLIYYYGGKARRRERRLLAQVEDAGELKRRANLRLGEEGEKVVRAEEARDDLAGQLHNCQIELDNAKAYARSILPEDALAIVTASGQLCPMRPAAAPPHPAGSEADCKACTAFRGHFDNRSV